MSEKLSDLNLVFSTPIWASLVDGHENLNKKLYNYIKKIQNDQPSGIQRSNVKGWHSPNFNLQDEEIKLFIESISPNIQKVINDMGWDPIKNDIKLTNIWSVVNTKSASNSRHSHPNAYISAAYYVKAPKNSGDIYFYDPRSANTVRTPVIKETTRLGMQQVNISPQSGLLIMFPSYLHHSVGENISEEERIVISFNIDLRLKNI